jgi:lipid-binding SYLF domain-containing protein
MNLDFSFCLPTRVIVKTAAKIRALFCVCAILGLFAHGAIAAESEEVKKAGEAAEVLKEVSAIPEKAIPPALLEGAYGVAVLPNVIKFGFIAGGRYGKGLLVVRKNGNWSDPTFVTIAGGSVGYQIGAESTDIILVFKTKRGIEGVTKGKITLGADAAVAAGPVGRQAEASTDIELKAEIYSYSRSRGLFAGVAIAGSSIEMDDKANASFYGRAVTPDEIFSGVVKAPPSAQVFKAELAKASSRR